MSIEPDEKDWLERIGAKYRGAPIDSVESRERLSARLRDEAPPRGGPLSASWWIARASFRARPLVLAGATLGVLGVGAWLGSRDPIHARDARTQTVAVVEAPAASAAHVPVMARATFALVAPGAARVMLVGDFNGWDPQATPLRRAATGDLWIADLPLPSGVHVYAFVVDGTEWIPDPSAPLAPTSAFGARTSVVVVGESSTL